MVAPVTLVFEGGASLLDCWIALLLPCSVLGRIITRWVVVS